MMIATWQDLLDAARCLARRHQGLVLMGASGLVPAGFLALGAPLLEGKRWAASSTVLSSPVARQGRDVVEHLNLAGFLGPAGNECLLPFFRGGASWEARNRVPRLTPTAPSANAAAIPRPS